MNIWKKESCFKLVIYKKLFTKMSNRINCTDVLRLPKLFFFLIFLSFNILMFVIDPYRSDCVLSLHVSIIISMYISGTPCVQLSPPTSYYEDRIDKTKYILV
jgi:hypothetical protein